MKYLCLIYYDEAQAAALPEAEYLRIAGEALAYGEELNGRGQFLASKALQPTETATTIRHAQRQGRRDRRTVRRDQGAVGRVLSDRGAGSERRDPRRGEDPATAPWVHRGAADQGMRADCNVWPSPRVTSMRRSASGRRFVAFAGERRRLRQTTREGVSDDRCTGFSGYAQGRVCSDVGRQAAELGDRGPVVRRLGGLSHEGLARRSEPHLRSAVAWVGSGR